MKVKKTQLSSLNFVVTAAHVKSDPQFWSPQNKFNPYLRTYDKFRYELWVKRNVNSEITLVAFMHFESEFLILTFNYQENSGK